MIILTVFLLGFTLVNCNVVNPTEDELIFTQLIFRHGSRTILRTYENDPYKDAKHWPEGFGQLTNLGKQQMYELGKYFRRRYENLLGDGSYHPDKVFVLSSARDRTMNSASLVLSGLFPPQNNQIWNEDLLWQPIPVNTIPNDEDYLLIAEGGCERHQKLLNEYQQTDEFKALIEKHRDLFEYLEKHAGQPIRNIQQLKDLQNVLEVEKEMNKTLPEWTQSVLIPGGPFEKLAESWLVITSATTELKRLKSGFLLREIMDRFKSKTLSTLSPDRSFWLYSAHDVTITGILNSLGVFHNVHIPPYASSLLCELYKSNDSFYIQLFYRKSNEENPTPLNIPNCGTKCPIDKFYELFDDILPTDFETECLPSNEKTSILAGTELSIMRPIMYWIVFLLCLFEFANCSGVNKTENELIFSQIIFRHGDRNIQFTYKNDPYKDKVNWPEGFAQLTNLGKQRAFELGQYFRRRYEQLLGDGSYHPDKVYTLSSAFDRTINSASLVLSGLFPPQDNQIWNKNLLWQPIPVYSIPTAQDNFLIFSKGVCPRYENVLKEYQQTAEIKEILDQHQELLQYLETHAGQPIRNLEQVKNLWGTLNVEHMMNKTLPEWTQKLFIPGGDFNYLNDYWYKILSNTAELKKLRPGFLLKEILERFQNKTRSTLTPDLLLYMYSGHETTLVTMLNSLGLFEGQIPPYSSCLLFELYKSSDDYYVQLFYRKSNEENPVPLNFPNCGTKCSLDRLFELYRDILPSDPETECKLQNEQ
ncbi:uncharacterized protein LOC116349294 [Contarinia nasturtii]|uniref:uncharacterized protein LOC116349294 n=1 Tax=Contarinia nasturtii TaxID=265458 RepID=UPI0012D44096|nr:uncharacterized protein LOC116349294 [Contarinia nasturtii]